MYSTESPRDLRILIKRGKPINNSFGFYKTIDEQSIIGYGTRFQSSVDSNLKVAAAETAKAAVRIPRATAYTVVRSIQ
jgi:hypothetical protein